MLYVSIPIQFETPIDWAIASRLEVVSTKATVPSASSALSIGLPSPCVDAACPRFLGPMSRTELSGSLEDATISQATTATVILVDVEPIWPKSPLPFVSNAKNLHPMFQLLPSHHCCKLFLLAAYEPPSLKRPSPVKGEKANDVLDLQLLHVSENWLSIDTPIAEIVLRSNRDRLSIEMCCNAHAFFEWVIIKVWCPKNNQSLWTLDMGPTAHEIKTIWNEETSTMVCLEALVLREAAFTNVPQFAAPISTVPTGWHVFEAGVRVNGLPGYNDMELLG